MDFLKNNRRFDFVYGGIPFSEQMCHISQSQTGNVLTTVYTLADGLRITNIATKYEHAYEWVNWLENTSDKPTQIISELYDACVTLPLPHEEPVEVIAFRPAFQDKTAVYAPVGSTCSAFDFHAFPDQMVKHDYVGHIPPGVKKTYATSGGRSSEKHAPFFNVHKDGKGYIFAVGWSGQWNCFLERTPDEILVKTKIEDTHFCLLPGEKVRTSSFVMMPYEGTVVQSHNQWRTLVKEHFSLIGKEGRDQYGPLCAGIWGGMKTTSVLERVHKIREYELPFEYIWMDAGWFGGKTMPSPDEFEGDWWFHSGDWRVSPNTHPGGLKDVAAAIHQAGMKFLLWVEPERAQKDAPELVAHPEYFIPSDDEENTNQLLNLGNEDAWNYSFRTLCNLIEEIGIDCYRQDFNIPPLPYWRKMDTKDRKGMTEIKHVNGLYRLWDALLEKFPHLIIDNCAGGGRRIDIETLRRSIPLWRSDFQCPANFLLEGTQCHNLSYNAWMPYSGTGTGRAYDTYRIRSCYSPALTTNYSFSERETFGDDPEKMVWLKKQLEEYLRVRPYMSEDFYPLTEVSDRTDIWSAAQFDRPSEQDGIVQIFRRENSPYETARFTLYGIDSIGSYVFTDADSGDEIKVSGETLLREGLCVTMHEKRSSKLYFYKKQ